MTLPPTETLVATPATRTLARQIITDTAWHGADATLKHLPDVRPTQVAALIHLLATAAVTGEIPASPHKAPRGRPLLLDEDERRRAHARWAAGHRDPATRRGEAEYQRAVKRTNREKRNVA